jgi:hypothetical protein
MNKHPDEANLLRATQFVFLGTIQAPTRLLPVTMIVYPTRAVIVVNGKRPYILALTATRTLNGQLSEALRRVRGHFGRRFSI